jgi:hypothetical protein
MSHETIERYFLLRLVVLSKFYFILYDIILLEITYSTMNTAALTAVRALFLRLLHRAVCDRCVCVVNTAVPSIIGGSVTNYR